MSPWVVDPVVGFAEPGCRNLFRNSEELFAMLL